MRKTCSAGSDVPSCFSVEIHEQIGRFVNPNAVQLCRVEFRRKALPDGNRYILCRRNLLKNSGTSLFRKR